MRRFSKKVVLAVIALNVIFAAAVLIVFWHTGSEPTVLVGSWFAFTTGELWTLSTIRKKEIEKGADNNEDMSPLTFS